MCAKLYESQRDSRGHQNRRDDAGCAGDTVPNIELAPTRLAPIEGYSSQSSSLSQWSLAEGSRGASPVARSVGNANQASQELVAQVESRRYSHRSIYSHNHRATQSHTDTTTMPHRSRGTTPPTPSHRATEIATETQSHRDSSTDTAPQSQRLSAVRCR